MSGVRLFRDPEMLKEMLDLRRKGHTFSYIARQFGADHTTIMFHCQAAGLALTAVQKEAMYDRVRQGWSVEEIGEELGVDSTVIELYCSQHGVAGSEQFITRSALKDIELTERQEYVRKRKELELKTGPINKVLFKTDSRGISWRTDEKGEWICLGRTEYRPTILSIGEKKKRLNQKRLEMLKY